jgi:Fic family protein
LRLSEARRKLTVVTEAIELLKKEGVFDQDKLFSTPEILSNKYKDWGMKVAIEDILKSAHGNKASAQYVISELQKHGFVSKSKNLKRDVYTRLFRLQKRGILGARKEGGLKKYFWKDEKIEEEPNKGEFVK